VGSGAAWTWRSASVGRPELLSLDEPTAEFDRRPQIQPCSQARWAAVCRELTPSLDMAADR
jgi:hypothetical protein